MESVPWLITVVEIEIDEVKSDVLAWVPIKHGVRFETTKQVKELMRKAFDELKEAPSKTSFHPMLWVFSRLTLENYDARLIHP